MEKMHNIARITGNGTISTEILTLRYKELNTPQVSLTKQNITNKAHISQNKSATLLQS